MKHNSFCLRLVLSTLAVTASLLLTVPLEVGAASAGSRATVSSAPRSTTPNQSAVSTSRTTAKPVNRSNKTTTPKPGIKPATKSDKPVKTPKKSKSDGKPPTNARAAPPPSGQRFNSPESRAELRRTIENYNAQVLKGKPDPYKKLTADPDKKIIGGPPGSNLVAMVKVRPSVGEGYRHEANQELANNAALQRELTARFAREQGDMQGQFVPPQKEGKSYKRPYLLRPDGNKVELEWHHSPHRVGTVSLIPVTTHRLGKDGMKRLHYVDPQTHKAQGGDKLYTVPPPPKPSAAEQP